MDKIGAWEIVKTVTVVLPEGEAAETSIPLNSLAFPVRIAFRDTSDTAEASIATEAQQDVLNIIFTNWSNTLGTATTAPIRIGFSSNRELAFMASHWRIGAVNKLDLQFLWRAAE